MDNLDRKTELLLYVSGAVFFGLFTLISALQSPQMIRGTASPHAPFITLGMAILTFFFIVLTFVKLEKGKNEQK